MTIFNVRAAEPLYIISLRNNQAESLLKSWIKEFKIEHASVNGNKVSKNFSNKRTAITFRNQLLKTAA